MLVVLAAASLAVGKYPLSIEKLLAGNELQWRVFVTLRLSRTVVGVLGGFALNLLLPVEKPRLKGNKNLPLILARLQDKTDGEVFFNGTEIFGLSKEELRKNRPNIQIIFQDPYSSLSPRLPIAEIIGEGVREHGIVPKTIIKEVRELIDIHTHKDVPNDLKNLTRTERMRLIDQLKKEMKNAAKLLEFEHAAYLRDRIAQLENGKG